VESNERFAELDKQLVAASKGIKILSTLGWGDLIAHEFLDRWRQGNPKMPEVTYPRFDYHAERDALNQIQKNTSDEHPVGAYIIETAKSYQIAAHMLESLGTAAFRECSEVLYGRPDEKTGHVSNLDLAADFIKITTDFSAMMGVDDDQVAILRSDEAAKTIKKRADDFFKDYGIKVLVDDELTSKAAAGSERVRVRGNSCFSHHEVEQLIQHEVFVHSATMLNGRRQPWLKSMGLGSPRTTATQEGLATFAELITGTMDLARLRRIALRIQGIHAALQGADFIEVFKFFLSSGQSEKESFQSAARIFRGGDVRGTNVFTKDGVYLKGLLTVHTFLRKAIQDRKLDYPQRLFAGRMTISDVIKLEGSFTDGWVSPAQYLPPWVANRQGLATYLCYNAFSNRLQLDDIRLEDFATDLVDFGALD
jgi:uncharacterized protein (TIGR02421 family)